MDFKGLNPVCNAKVNFSDLCFYRPAKSFSRGKFNTKIIINCFGKACCENFGLKYRNWVYCIWISDKLAILFRTNVVSLKSWGTSGCFKLEGFSFSNGCFKGLNLQRWRKSSRIWIHSLDSEDPQTGFTYSSWGWKQKLLENLSYRNWVLSGLVIFAPGVSKCFVASLTHDAQLVIPEIESNGVKLSSLIIWVGLKAYYQAHWGH